MSLEKLTEKESKEFMKSYRAFRSGFKAGNVTYFFSEFDHYNPTFYKYYQPDIIDENGETFFTSMAKNGKSGAIGELIRAGDDINAKNAHGFTPLMLAAIGNYPVVVKRLLDAGANKTIKNNDGKTALELAQMMGAEKCVKCLTRKGIIQ